MQGRLHAQLRADAGPRRPAEHFGRRAGEPTDHRRVHRPGGSGLSVAPGRARQRGRGRHSDRDDRRGRANRHADEGLVEGPDALRDAGLLGGERDAVGAEPPVEGDAGQAHADRAAELAHEVHDARGLRNQAAVGSVHRAEGQGGQHEAQSDPAGHHPQRQQEISRRRAHGGQQEERDREQSSPPTTIQCAGQWSLSRPVTGSANASASPAGSSTRPASDGPYCRPIWSSTGTR